MFSLLSLKPLTPNLNQLLLLISLTTGILTLLNVRPVVSQPAATLYDNLSLRKEQITWTGLNPHQTYTVTLKNVNYLAKGQVNECGILKVNAPSGFPAVQAPFDDSTQSATVIYNGTTKNFYWGNNDGAENGLTASDMTCANLSSSGLPWAVAKSKGVIYYWEPGIGLPNNSVLPVVIKGNDSGGSGRDRVIKKKSNTCGIASFDYYWAVDGGDKPSGYLVNYDEDYILKKDDTTVATTDWDFLDYYHKPFCKNGSLYTSEQTLY